MMGKNPLSFERDTIFEASSDIVVRKNQDGTVIIMRMDDSEVFYKIDGVAAEIWSSIVEKKNLNTIIDEIKEKNNVSEDVLCKDMDKFLKDLLKYEMISKQG